MIRVGQQFKFVIQEGQGEEVRYTLMLSKMYSFATDITDGLINNVYYPPSKFKK